MLVQVRLQHTVRNCLLTNKTKNEKQTAPANLPDAFGLNEFQLQKRLASFLKQRAHRFPTIRSEAPNGFLVCLISQLGLKEFGRIFTLPSKSPSFVFGQFSLRLVGIIGKSAVRTIRGAVQLRSVRRCEVKIPSAILLNTPSNWS